MNPIAKSGKRLPAWLVGIAVSVAFAVLFGVGLVASSLIFEPERLINEPLGFWLSVVLKTIIQLVSFNLAYFIFITSKKSDSGSNLSRAFQTYAQYVKQVYAKNLQPQVRTQIKKVNRQRFEETSDILLENTTESLHYVDLFDTDPDTGERKPTNFVVLVRERAKHYGLTPKQQKTLLKYIVKIINGRVEYPKVDYNEVMLGADKVKGGYVSMSTAEGTIIVKRNLVMIVTAFAIAVITTVFALGQINGNILYEILSSALTIIISTLSAFIWGGQVVTQLIRAYTARRDFFSDFIVLDPESPQTSSGS